ncbi:MAG: helix-turn-helix transcriptional regulator [Bacilli bacterium]|nr:helix-turn-helix transcriptional regulator [Bacilli bacterium]MDD3305024.1 helix-turn-helix transcriptional regulator [Bacilli bacterium]MDD4053645.1 helix-turn-helix transcriptional regulator [Bacilli bacterium]MDD4411144.1 helix-turn-helix transcriptional regulator [Bacilli bacterium]
MIVLRLDRVLADRKVSSKKLALNVGINEVNMSLLKRGKIKSIRLELLNSICKHLNCQPKDILEYIPDFED